LNTASELSVYVIYQGGSFDVRIHEVSVVKSASHAPAVPTIPIVAGLAQTSDMLDLIQSTIRRGSFAWNKGYQDLCAMIYTSAARSILVAEKLPASARGVACAALQRVTGKSWEFDGWLVRSAFDAILADAGGSARPPLSNYPVSVQGLIPTTGFYSESALTSCWKMIAYGTLSSASPGSVVADNMTGMDESLESFHGPFVGMGISGFNQFELVYVASPNVCAKICLATPMCRSFDYEARGYYKGRCFRSMANRVSAASSYTAWQNYDYYELKTDATTTATQEATRAGQEATTTAAQATTRAAPVQKVILKRVKGSMKLKVTNRMQAMASQEFKESLARAIAKKVGKKSDDVIVAITEDNSRRLLVQASHRRLVAQGIMVNFVILVTDEDSDPIAAASNIESALNAWTPTIAKDITDELSGGDDIVVSEPQLVNVTTVDVTTTTLTATTAALTTTAAITTTTAITTNTASKSSTTKQAIGVSCGGHIAATCAECPAGQGAAYCNGVCIWSGGSCMAKVLSNSKAPGTTTIAVAVGQLQTNASPSAEESKPWLMIALAAAGGIIIILLGIVLCMCRRKTAQQQIHQTVVVGRPLEQADEKGVASGKEHTNEKEFPI
jgi:hypothetical protein